MASFESYPEPEEKPQADPKKRRLRVVLGIAIVALAAVAVVVGMTIWRNSALSTGHQTDTEALTQSTAGVNDTTFNAVKLQGIPPCSKMYGKTLKELKVLPDSKLSFGPKLKKAKDDSGLAVNASVAKSIKYYAKADIGTYNGASLEVFFDKKKHAVAAQYKFDLDDLGVAEADFSVFAADRKVASSLLQGVGLNKKVVSAKALDSLEGSPAISGSGNEKACSFKGDTGAKYEKVAKKKKVYSKKKHKKVTKKITKDMQVDFMFWQLDEVYTYSSGDGATTRTARITLF